MSIPGDPIPVMVVTGFLGAGKTTLVNRILADPAFADTAVVVNEFGSVDVDGDLVRTAAHDLVAASTGCLCCTASADIRATLFDLHETARARLSRPFSRVIVETTGLADPSAVINALTPGALPAVGLRDHTVARRFRLAAVLTLVDALTGDLTLDRYLEAVKQAAFADAILLTKTDSLRDTASRRDLDALADRVAGLAPAAAVVTEPDNLDLASLFGRRYAPDRHGGDAEGWLAIDRLIRGTRPKDEKSAGLHADDLATLVLRSAQPIDRAALDVFLTLLQNTAGAEVLRVKGLVALEDDPDRPAVVHMVRHVIHPPVRLAAWPSADRTSRLVVIGRGLDAERLQKAFDAFAERATPPATGRRSPAVVVLAGIAAAAIGFGAALAASSAGPGGRHVHTETEP